MPDHLERVDQVLCAGETCSACGGELHLLGEDVTEELEYMPGRFIVNRIVRPRLACRCCEAVVQADLPSRPIEKAPVFWPMCWSPNTPIICRFIASRKSRPL